MSQISEYFRQAELSLAAYADLSTGVPNEDELKKAGMSSTQATRFAATWSVAAHYSDVTGVSATVFQEISTGQKTLAIRGTQGVTDFITDYFILNGTPSQLNPQYQSLKTKVQAWLGDGTLTPGFSVSGHSLGGYLAAGLVADFSASISHAWLYNAPGNNSLVSQVMQALGVVATPDATKITSLRADAGISPIAGLGSNFSPLNGGQVALNGFQALSQFRSMGDYEGRRKEFDPGTLGFAFSSE
ncbi:MAG: alpha/beta hydrolase family protein [Sulfuricella sp.]